MDVDYREFGIADRRQVRIMPARELDPASQLELDLGEQAAAAQPAAASQVA